MLSKFLNGAINLGFIMGDPNDILLLYVKTWFTIIVEFAIELQETSSLFCLNHNDVTLLIPKPDIKLRYHHCDFLF